MIEISTIRSEDALENPIFKQIILFRELNRAAQQARENNDEEFAALLDDAAQMVEGQFGGDSRPGEAAGAPGVNPNQLPEAVQEVLGGFNG